MRTLSSAVVALSLVALLPAAGLAQTGSSSSSGTRGTTTERSTTRAKAPQREAWTNTDTLHDAKDIIGTHVRNAEGKDIGRVQTLLVDPKDGKISQAVIALGGVLGLGSDKVVVPYSELKMNHDGKKTTLTIDQSVAEKAPKYTKTSDRSSPSASPRSTSDKSSTPSSSHVNPSAPEKKY